MDIIGTFLRNFADSIDPPPPAASTAAPVAAAESPWANANEAAAKVSSAVLAIEAWRQRNLNAAKELDVLAKTLNSAIEDAKPLVAEFPGETIGPFNVAQRSVKKGYDPALLPDEVRGRKGVLVLTVDTKVVDALVKCGEVDEVDVVLARTETVGSASVRGPKQLVVKP